MQFKASLSNTSKVITIIVSVLLIGINVPILFFETREFWVTLSILILTVSNLIICWGFSVSGYKIENDILIISRPFGSKKLSLETIRSAERVGVHDLRFSLRTFGNGGLFGFYGKFWNKNLGNMTWYATNLNHAVLLTLSDGKKMVVTPDEPQNFITNLNSFTAK